MSNLAVDYGQASTVSRNITSALNYLEEEISKINSAISEIEALNRGYGKTSTILNELYNQQKKAQTAYDEMQQFSEKFSGFISNVKTTDSEMAKKFKADVKTYCKKNNIEITSDLAAFLDKVQVVLDVVGFIPVLGEVADALNAVISLCRGNYLEALICLVAILPMGDLLKGLKFADKAKDLLKYGDEVLAATKTVAKEGAEKLSKQMTKIVKSGKLDNVIATMDAGKDFAVRFKNGSTALIKKGDLSEFVCQVFKKGCFMAGTLVNTREGLKLIEEIVIGDYVLSRNEESGETSYKKVTDTLIRSTYNICTIELENGKIESTTGHLFMVKDKWWKAATELNVGEVLETADGKCQVVKNITVEQKGYPVNTYNLSVEENHTFFVNKEGILTHNMAGFKTCDLKRVIPGTPGVVTGGSSKKLGENLFREMGLPTTTKRTPYQAMHIIPKEFKSHPVIKKIGMDFDDASNGIFLKNRKTGGVSPMSRHEGNHKAFNDFIESKLDNIDINKDINELEKDIYTLQQKCKALMEEGLPMYAKDNERIDKFGDIMRKLEEISYGDKTIELWERWFKK